MHGPNFNDLQGMVIRGYRLPVARYYFLRLHQDVADDELASDIGDIPGNREPRHRRNEEARTFIAAVRQRITVGSADQWPITGDGFTRMPPDDGATTNIAFTYPGLAALGVPAGSLHGFPVEFEQGMKLRAALLGDTGTSDPSRWDPMWLTGRVHVWISINAIDLEALEARDGWLRQLVAHAGGAVELLEPTREPCDWQPAAALVIDGMPSNKEHFGYSDGIANPVFEGMGRPNIPGRGKLQNGKWAPLATGELLLGYPNEAGEVPPAPLPHVFARNGTYMVYRKLHQRVRTFMDYLAEQAATYREGEGLLAAKWAGRWRNGAPLTLYPGEEPDATTVDMEERRNWNNFRYRPDDTEGKVCPMGAHIRRANPRDALGFEGKLANGRRIARRGLPYGAHMPRGEETDDGEHGIIFMALNASISRQFEFVQQQWMEYGNDFRLGNDKDVFIGTNDGHGKVLIQGDPPHVCPRLPHFVECRGGDYFFVPSMTALRLLANQSVNPL